MNVQETKRAVRRRVLAALKGLSDAQRAAASGQACALLKIQACWQQARFILFYAPMPGELDIWPLLEAALAAGKMAGLPRFDSRTGQYVACRIRNVSRDVVDGQFGIREPAAHCPAVELDQPDLVLVPCVAFDIRGHRLGRGKGYYDRLLKPVRGVTCGVAFEEQMVDSIPVEPHDVVLSCVLTPTRWIVG